MLTQKYPSFVTKLQTYTKTTKEISTIDMFDVSNLGQTYQVGACTVFHKTKPQFKSFRKFIIPSHLTNDAERTYFLVKKRYASLQKEKQTITSDLLIMDGGIIQIKAARKALTELNITLPIIGLVKNNHHQTESLMNEQQETFAFAKTSLFYLWLANMQTITHEQAIKYHHKRKQQGDLVDPLLTIPGISIRLSELLYQHFSCLELLQKADFTDINKIIRNKATTNRLLQFLKTKLM